MEPLEGANQTSEGRFLFPRWANTAPTIVAVVLGGVVTVVVLAAWYYLTNKHIEVGYQPAQPVEFSHKLHAGDLGMDCRYCHSTVERSPLAAVPPTQTCMNCHSKVKADSPLLEVVRQSARTEAPIPWVRVHNLADYVYFDHSVHLTAGVGCSTCHGRVDQMPRVTQREPLSMSWCTDCHRAPGRFLRQPGQITDMAWQPPEPTAAPAVAANGRQVNPPLHCSGCHR